MKFSWIFFKFNFLLESPDLQVTAQKVLIQ